MRVIVALAGAALALSLSGCDMRGGEQKQAACNCATTPAVVPPAAAATPPDMRGSTAYMPPEEHHYRHHYRPRGTAWNGHGDYHHGHFWRREWSEISVAMYDYHSSSTSTYAGGDAYHGGGDYHGEHDGGYHDADHGWIDGYGRGHGGYVGDAVHTGSHGDDGRDRPWHGYDADCPDDPHHHH